MTDPDLTDDELQLSRMVQDYFASFVDNDYLNRQEQGVDGYDAGHWKQMAELDWLGIHVPEELGGGGGTLVDAALVARGAGRAAYASPLLAGLRAATVLLELGAGGAANDALRRVAAGGRVALVAPADRTLTVDDGRVVGAPVVVEWLAGADDVVLLLPTTGGQWCCAVLPAVELAARTEAVPSTDNERIARLDADGLVLAPDRVVAEPDASSATRALARADLLRASLLVGGCEAVLEMTTRYALEREQFGKQIATFQAVRHMLARMLMATDAARLSCNEALAGLDAEDTLAAARVAAFVAGRSYLECVLNAAQIHGGVGTTTEHVLHHHFQRAKAMQLRGGRRADRLRELTDLLVREPVGSLW